MEKKISITIGKQRREFLFGSDGATSWIISADNETKRDTAQAREIVGFTRRGDVARKVTRQDEKERV